MLETKSMTMRRTEAFLRELRFDKQDIDRVIIAAFQRKGETVIVGNRVNIRSDANMTANVPARSRYYVEIDT